MLNLSNPDRTPKLLYGIILAPLILYFKSLSFEFTSMDEQWMIIKDVAFLQKWSSVFTAFTEPSTDNYYRPLFLISLITDYHLGKLNPMIYHFTNLIWHLTTVILLFKFLNGLDIEKKQAFILSLLFSVHPVLLHAIAWVPGRNDIVLCVFILASLIRLRTFIKTEKQKDFWLHLVYFICALFTKESAIVLPFIYIIFSNIYGKYSIKKITRLSLIWVFIALSWFSIRNSIIGGISTSDSSFISDSINFLKGYLMFLGKIFFPFQQSILPSPKYTSLFPGIISLVVLIVFCFYPGLKNRKTAYLGLFIFFSLLVIPVWFGAIKSGSEHYEQRMYGSFIGITLFFSQVKFNIYSKLYSTIIGLLFVSYCVKTYYRMNVYKDELTYCEAGIIERPDFYLFYLQKADILNKRHEYQASLAFYDKAIHLRPNFAQALCNRGSVNFDLGNFEAAAADYSKAIEYSEFNKLYYINRCKAYYKTNEIEKAMHDFGVLKKNSPEIIEPDFEKDLIAKWLQLLEGIQKDIQKEPLNASLYFKYANLYFGVELIPQGIAFLKRAIELDPSNKSYTDLLKKYSNN